MICEEKRKSSGFLLSIPLSQHQMNNLTCILVSLSNGSERSEAGMVAGVGARTRVKWDGPLHFSNNKF
jgi:hypothetical protein